MPRKTYAHPSWIDRWIKKSGDGPLDIALLPERQRPKMRMISKAVEILNEYQKQGYQLTLRQLYYQFVSRDLIPNTEASYNKLGDAISDGRMWGFIDWDHLVDRGRNLLSHSHWSDPGDVIKSAARGYRLDLWEASEVRPEVWVEKQALEDVVGKACAPLDVGYMACKGYMSQSELWAASQRIIEYEKHQRVVVIHLGDHDPSGIDMTRDNLDRLHTFGADCEIRRIALNMSQIHEYKPPPNPAKSTDSRFKEYAEMYGNESWELDALEPAVITSLIEDEINQYIDEEYEQRAQMQESDQVLLNDCADRWDSVVEFLDSNED